ncbi:hypothetical protein CEUSTIGMA_g13549.t1 [Chlamydomonas eustigma]|uniref:Uncharacterized protein n=1 Tax=Chlamydomonas eustigma TaxID=1157962 RepID=A0A250XSX3_9CHLO|nr:hypothetical protein CEUSTIGMA_g13549.t1 [Chlamydomonas eustigma]|eukprot:GAX86136.1 hypothetical protein CEUSTIGMA_g13549.t1 [Chlamydomonas eustigma]
MAVFSNFNFLEHLQWLPSNRSFAWGNAKTELSQLDSLKTVFLARLKREKPKILQKDAAYKLMSIAYEQGRLIGTQILLQELQKGNSRLSHYLDVLVSDSETEDLCFMSLKHCHSLLSLLDSAFHGRIVCPAQRVIALCNSSSVMDGIASLHPAPSKR